MDHLWLPFAQGSVLGILLGLSIGIVAVAVAAAFGGGLLLGRAWSGS